MLLAAGTAPAQYPSKPIRIVAHFPPGGTADFTARVFEEHFSKAFGQPAVVENLPGAGGVIAAERNAKAVPDGYTLIVGSTGHGRQGRGDPAGIAESRTLNFVELISARVSGKLSFLFRKK